MRSRWRTRSSTSPLPWRGGRGCAKAHAALRGRSHVASEDIAAVAHPVLRHRIVTNFTAQAEGMTSDMVIDRLLEEVRIGSAVGAGVTGKSSL